jgi:arsenite-transporting ATPase
LPGIQEVLGLHEVGELADSGEWDHVVVDCASTADALRMLTLPATFGCTWSGPGRGTAGCPAPTTPRGGGRRAVERISAGTDSSARCSPTATGQRAPGADRRAGGRRRGGPHAGLAGADGCAVDELIVNQILVQDDSFEYRNLPEHPAFDWYSERISEQQAVLDELDATIGDVQLVLVPHLAGEPIGPRRSANCSTARAGATVAAAGPLRPIVDRESGLDSSRCTGCG